LQLVLSQKLFFLFAFSTAPLGFSFPEHPPVSQPTEHGSLPPTDPRGDINTGHTLEPVSQGNSI